jgi:hypothetical protein
MFNEKDDTSRGIDAGATRPSAATFGNRDWAQQGRARIENLIFLLALLAILAAAAVVG